MLVVEKSSLKTYHADSFSQLKVVSRYLKGKLYKKKYLSLWHRFEDCFVQVLVPPVNISSLILLSRFDKHHFVRLVNGLRLPDFYVCQQRTVCPGMEALLILLRRLTYPNRWCELTQCLAEQNLNWAWFLMRYLCFVKSVPIEFFFVQLTEIISNFVLHLSFRLLKTFIRDLVISYIIWIMRGWIHRLLLELFLTRDPHLETAGVLLMVLPDQFADPWKTNELCFLATREPTA